MMEKAAHAHAERWLFLFSFVESSFFPIPPHPLLGLMCLARPEKALRYGFICTLASVLGGLFGYAIGYFAWLTPNGDHSSIACFMFDNIPGFSVEMYNKIQMLYTKWDFWILFVAALIPLPYKIFSISSGVFDINLLVFSVATLVSQGIKFYFLALLIVKTGTAVKKMLEFNFKPIAIVATACVAIIIIIISF